MQQGARRATALLWAGLLLGLAASASGVLWRPAGWHLVYDVGCYNLVYLAGAALCWQARGRAPGCRALALALVVNAVGNSLYSLVVAPLDPEPYPSVADVFYLGFYPLLYAAVLGAVRSRVRRLPPSMWLDGLVAGLGSAAVASAFLLGPALRLSGGDAAAVVTNLAYPVADLLLVVLLAASAAVLGLRADRGLVVLSAGLGCYLVADVAYLHEVSGNAYVEGGLLDQVWLVGTAALALAATLPVRPDPGRVAAGVRLGWRILALPVVSSVASGTVLALGYGSALPRLAAWCALGCWLAGLTRTALTFRDIRDLHGARLQARTDELTGLPNRRAGTETWPATLAGRASASLVLFDLDGFKDINDTLGHHAGDALLRQVAARLRAASRSQGVAVRLGGDEFAVLVPGSAVDALALAERLREQALGLPFTVEGVRLHVVASFGVAQGDRGEELAEVLRRADVAMYHAKRTRTGVAVYDEGLSSGMSDRLRTVEELHTALRTGQLLIHLQPQVRPSDGCLVGAEALVRWEHPTRGLLSPADLLPAAEQAGLMGPIAETVLDLALGAATTWWPRLLLPVSVNLSAANLSDLDLPAKVRRLLEHHGLPPQVLTLEVVEDTLAQDPERARGVLATLRELGVSVSIDDYGTGYSSLAYLSALPADELKVDRVFVAALATDRRVRAIVEHTISLAHVLDLRVVAEGVEDEETLALLGELGCDAAQGFHMARPMPVPGFLALLARTAPEARSRALVARG